MKRAAAKVVEEEPEPEKVPEVEEFAAEPGPAGPAVFIPPTKEWDVAALIDADYNPREITERELADLQASMEDFGLVEDVVVNVHPERHGVVIGGHQRLKILRAKGVPRIPCKEVSLTLERERELNIRLNANGGRFDSALLAQAFDREDLESWGLSPEDLAAFDRAATIFKEELGEGGGEAAGEQPIDWRGMPEYAHQDLEPQSQIKVSFRTDGDRTAFAAVLGRSVTDKTRSIWYPEWKPEFLTNMRFQTAQPVASKYPIYIPSKGRWESRQTVRALERMNVPYRVVIEAEEYDQYAAVIDPAKLLVLPFSGRGLVPSRCWIMEHSIAEGHERHWQLDDNIVSFHRYESNFKYRSVTGAIFRSAEDFSDRWTNVAISGLQYYMFVPRKSGAIPPYVANTRVYSCSLINNAIPHRWRDVYNDDTDICLRALKDGWCTILFNAFLCWKSTTMTVKGGNTGIYQGAGRLKMAESLMHQHPDVVTITEKWGRFQHHVDYRPFKGNQLIPRAGVEISEEPDNYGMYLEVDPEPLPEGEDQELDGDQEPEPEDENLAWSQEGEPVEAQ